MRGYRTNTESDGVWAELWSDRWNVLSFLPLAPTQSSIIFGSVKENRDQFCGLREKASGFCIHVVHLLIYLTSHHFTLLE